MNMRHATASAAVIFLAGCSVEELSDAGGIVTGGGVDRVRVIDGDTVEDSAESRGVWSADNVPPWEWRQR